MEEPDIEKINKKIAEEAEGELVRLIKSKINNVKIRPRGSGAMPPEKDLNKLEKGTYKTNFEVPGYQILAKSPTVIFYKRITDNTVVIAVRGSSDKRDWLQTNTMLPFGRLTTTSRYKEDKKFVADNLAKFSQGNDVYIVGHSLGGAIANQLQIDFPIIQGGITFNPAFQPMDFLNKSKIQRKYTSGDPLGKLGRYLPGSVVEDDSSLLDRFIPSVGVMGKSHQLSSFQSGQEGGKKVCMDKKAYVKEHKKLIKLLDKAGKEGQEQKKELEKELKIGGMNKNELNGEVVKDLLKKYAMNYDIKIDNNEDINLIIKLVNDTLTLNNEIPYKKRNWNDDDIIHFWIRTYINNNYDINPDMYIYTRQFDKDIFPNEDKVQEMAEDGANYFGYEYSPEIITKIIKNMNPEDRKKFGFNKGSWQNIGGMFPHGDGDLHAIIIKKKGYDKNDAVVEAAKFKTSKGLFMRETKLSYRFRNIPKTKFEPKSFRSKKINKNITLVYGKLK